MPKLNESLRSVIQKDCAGFVSLNQDQRYAVILWIKSMKNIPE